MTGVSIHGTGMTTDDVIKKAHDTLPVATSSAAGVVKIGSGVDVTGDGTISVSGGGGGGGGGFTNIEGTLTLTGGVAEGIAIIGGQSDGDNQGGNVNITGGADSGGGGAGNVTIAAGSATIANYDPGAVIIKAGEAASTGPGGNVIITSTPGNVSGNGGSVIIQARGGAGSDSTSGRIQLMLESGDVGPAAGQLVIANLPLSDPSFSQAIWSDNGVLVQSGHTAPVTTGLNVTSIDWSTAPTSDPAQAGALWNDGGTLKISAG